MIPLRSTVLLIENNLDDAPKIAELISLSGYDAIRTPAVYPLDVVNTIQAHSPEVIMSHMSQSNMAIEAILKSPKLYRLFSSEALPIRQWLKRSLPSKLRILLFRFRRGY